LLDEPLAALDASIRGYLRDQIRSIQKRFNTTTLLVTHDQEEALTMADQVAVLKDGRLLQLAPPKEIYAFPTTKDVAEFVGLSTIFPVTISGQDQIDTGFCRLSASTGKRTPGQKAFALARPEHLIPDPAEGVVNRLEGRLGAVRYLGSVYRYDFEVEGADKAFLVESSHVAERAIAVPPEHIRLLDH
jgi:putative spermidine/putrescine transport system ATP-binding protein